MSAGNGSREGAKVLKELKERSEPLKNKDRLAIPPQPMPEQDPKERRRNIREVAQGYSREQAVVEAMRCLQCKNAPCIEGCPVHLDIPGFIAKIAEEDFDGAATVLRKDTLLPAVCGRVCPQETQCQMVCTVGKALKDRDKGVAIGRLERYAADFERVSGNRPLPDVEPESEKSVAIIGSGPASLVVAADVRRRGHAVTIFEAFQKPGGVMVYGIPEFRLPKAIVEDQVDILRRIGVEIKTSFVVGRTRKLTDLLDKDGFDAVFVGTGAGLPRFMGIEGENLVGVFSANEYLTRANLMRAYDIENADTPIFHSKKTVVLGGGNVAMDSARMALRLGAEEVTLVYRRTEKEMPARVEEVHHAKEEGIDFKLLQNAKRILGNDDQRVVGIECLRYELGEPDESGRRRPVPIEGSEFVIDCDAVIVAIGNDSNPLIKQTTPDIEVNKKGNVLVDESGKTSVDRVYAGGDIVLGAATVIAAMEQGQKAAAAINEMLATV